MSTRLKIKIYDNAELRNRLDIIYEKCNQVQLCKYALMLSKHIMEISGYDFSENSVIKAGFDINEKWQQGLANMYQVRQAGFAIHKIAKSCDDVKE